MMAYVDDIVVFLQLTQEWETLLEIYSKYNKASNAKINLHKTALLSLSGYRHLEWKSLASRNDIVWYDKDSSKALTYLGYPPHSTQAQLNQYLDMVYGKLQQHVDILRARTFQSKVKQ
jgi:hypothetical protein